MKRIALCAAVLAWLLLVTPAAPASAGPLELLPCTLAAPAQAHCDASLLESPHSHRLIRPDVRSLGAKTHSAQPGADGSPAPLPGSPLWLQQAYDLTALSARQGSGDTIAIVDPDNDPAVASDLATFRRTYGLPACDVASGCLRVVDEQGATSPLPPSDLGWATEETIDIDAASAVCPRCSILLVEASSTSAADLSAALQTAANLGANQISASWSITATASPFPTDLVTPTSPGAAVPSVFAASGDEGSDPLGEAEYPAALPTVTAVGGTTLTSTSSSSDPRGYAETAWADAGSGCALGEQPLSYQPSTGCAGRAYSDVSADADPVSGLNIFEAAEGGWAISGGTSLATPIVAAFAAVTGVDAQTPQWAYTDAPALNDPASGSDGACATGLSAELCIAGAGYDGPTGAGSVSGAVVAGAPGISAPLFQNAGRGSDTEALTARSAQLAGGIDPNQEATSYLWQYGTSASYGQQTAAGTIPAGLQPVAVNGLLPHLQPGTTYHLRLKAMNASGISYGDDMTLVTAGTRTSASRSAAQSGSISSAQSRLNTGKSARLTGTAPAHPTPNPSRQGPRRGLGWLGPRLAVTASTLSASPSRTHR